MRFTISSFPLTLACGLLLAHPALQAGNLTSQQACSDFYTAANPDVNANLFISMAPRAQEKLVAKLAQYSAQSLATPSEPNLAKLRALLLSYRDRNTVEQLGLTPLATELALIDSLNHKDQLPVVLAKLQRSGVAGPVKLDITADMHTEKPQLRLDLTRADSYDDASFRRHATRIFQILGQSGVAATATDAVVRMNRGTLPPADQPAAEFDFVSFQRHLGVPPEHQAAPAPTTRQHMAQLVGQFTLTEWKYYLRWQLIRAYTPYLPHAFIQAQAERQTRLHQLNPLNYPAPSPYSVLSALLDSMPGAVQQLYFQQIVPADRRERALDIARQLRSAMEQRIDTRAWLSPTGKAAAQARLRDMKILMGKPEHWIDYRELETDPAGLLANVKRAAEFNLMQRIRSLGTIPEQGHMSKSNWNAEPGPYFSRPRNAVVIPPPLLDSALLSADRNLPHDYGSFATIVAHEMLHGFDHPDHQTTPDNTPADWPVRPIWLQQASDVSYYNRMADRQLADFRAYFRLHEKSELPVPYPLVEEFADLSTAPLAWDALKRVHPAGRKATSRFYESYARVRWETPWRASTAYRVNYPLSNLRRFASTYGCTATDPMVKQPNQRVRLW